MRRIALVSAVAALFVLSLGCKSTSGRCDCNYDAANHVLPTTGMTYPTVGAPIGGPTSTATPAPVTPVK